MTLAYSSISSLTNLLLIKSSSPQVDEEEKLRRLPEHSPQPAPLTAGTFITIGRDERAPRRRGRVHIIAAIP